MKAFALAAALEEGLVEPDDRFDCEQGSWRYQGTTITDVHASGVLSVSEILARSSNIGFVKLYDRLGSARLTRWLRAFHFGMAPTLDGAAPGSVPKLSGERSVEGAWTTLGAAMTASPLQVAAAYATLANDGTYVAPTLTRRTGEIPREAVLKPATARSVLSLLEHVVTDENATGTEARVDGERVAGKTGTAAWTLSDGSERYYASFVGVVPSTAPRFVILVGLEEPEDDDGKPGSGGGGGHAAGPVFARVARRALAETTEVAK
jgi:cell division protein FtsI (penicillin-binding protein 3)